MVRFLICELQKMPTMHRPPTCCWLPPDAVPHWHAVAAGLPANALDIHLILAVLLARCMADVERIDGERRNTDDPRRAALLLRVTESLTRTSIALTRAVGIAPSARHRLADVQAGRAAERQAREAAQVLRDIAD